MSAGGYEFHMSPPFLRAKAEQRLALLRELGVVASAKSLGINVIMSTLTDAGQLGVSQEVWNESCDGCGLYAPKQIYTGHMFEMIDNIPVDLTFGVCEGCKNLMAQADQGE